MKTGPKAANLLISCLCLSFIAMFLSGCSSSSGGGGKGNISGTIVNLSYNPVSNADVNVDGTITKSLSNGTYSFINLSSGDKLVKISATAYTSSYKRVSISGGQSANAGISVLANLDSKVTPISPSGGTATNTNGSIKMVFPPNAFGSETKDVVLTNIPKVAAPYSPPGKDEFVSYIVYAKPEDTTLSGEAKLSVPNLTQVPSTAEVLFYKFNTSSLVWDQLPGYGHSTAETGTIDFYTDQMGWIAAIMPIFPWPGWIEGTVSGGTPISGANVWTMTSNTVSDQFGTYKLENIPVGTNEVYASALGYIPYSSKPPWPLVTTELGTTFNINMTSVPQGNIDGLVYELNDGQIANARVVALQGGAQKGEAYTDEYGRFTLYNLPAPVSTTVTAYADNHVQSSESVSVIAGETVTADTFRLPPVGTLATYEFTFETSNEGFITIADDDGHDFWHRQSTTETSVATGNKYRDYFSYSTPQRVYLSDSGYIPNAHNGNYYFWYGQKTPATSEASYIGIEDHYVSEEGSGGESLLVEVNSGTLESPELNLTGYSFGKLSFWTWWEIEGKNPGQGNFGHDWMLIYISKGPSYSTWDLLGYLNPYEDPAKEITVSGEAYTSGGFNQPGIWVQHNYNLTPYAGNFIKIRFFFNTGDRKYNGFRGWFLDDIKVENSQFGISSLGSHGIMHYPPAIAVQRN